MITLGAVNITAKTKELMQKILEEGRIGQGKYIQELEQRLAGFFGVKHALCVANGTMADAVALAAVKQEDESKRDEVIVPALTFIAQINAVYYNHLKPVFVDVGYDYEINADKIEEKITEKTLAIMPTHLLGRPAKMDKIVSLAKKHNLFIVEDACEALGSKYNGKLCGTIGDMGCFSFFVSHSITTGEGGAIITDNDELAELVFALRNHGRKSNKPEEAFIFPYVGFSAKMNCLEAVVGLGIVDELPKYIGKRRQNMLRLSEALGKSWFAENEGEYICPHAYPVILESGEKRDKALAEFSEKFGIEARQIFYSLPTQSEAYRFLGEKEGAYPVAEDIGRRGLYVPCHQNLSEEEVTKIGEALKQCLAI